MLVQSLARFCTLHCVYFLRSPLSKIAIRLLYTSFQRATDDISAGSWLDMLFFFVRINMPVLNRGVALGLAYVSPPFFFPPTPLQPS